MSPEFADEAALCLAANGIKAYVFESLRPTPELSYAVRKLGCIAGINITASHNPPEYNGYKVYWEDGAQITPPHDSGIMDEVRAVASFDEVKTMDKDEDDIVVGLNGKIYRIQRVKYVRIPKDVYDIIRQSMAQDAATAEYLESKSREYEAVKQQLN